MSWSPCPDPTLGDSASVDAVETVIVPRAVDLGEMTVRRALPSRQRQMVGPFIFFDQMGPAEFLTDQGIDVRPHPHVNLATVTYLLEGEILHRDSLGTEQAIRPGAVNWMKAGTGIVHSERTSNALKQSGQRLFGLQTWVALPEAEEETAQCCDSHASGSDSQRIGKPCRKVGCNGASSFERDAPIERQEPVQPTQKLTGKRPIEPPLRSIGRNDSRCRSDIHMSQEHVNWITWCQPQQHEHCSDNR